MYKKHIVLVSLIIIFTTGIMPEKEVSGKVNISKELQNEKLKEKAKREEAKREEAKREEVKREEAKREEYLNSRKNIEIKPNEDGEIIVVAYHGIGEDGTGTVNPYYRSIEGFKSDMIRLYKEGYYIVPAKDYVNNKMDVPKGFTPVVITFDDGLSSVFSLNEIDGELHIKENTAVSIMNEIAKEYIGFNPTATIYINGHDLTFLGDGTLEQRINMILDLGFDIGNHSYYHLDLNKEKREVVESQLGRLNNYMLNIRDTYKIDTVAYPYGTIPRYRETILKGYEKGIEYNHIGGFLAWSNGKGETNPNNIKFNKTEIPRVKGVDYDEKYNLSWYLDYYKKYPYKKYISDGKM